MQLPADCRNIMIVEDDEDIRESIKEVLVLEGYSAKEAGATGFMKKPIDLDIH